jgi:GT2 family glycosyltransferase
MRRVAIIITNYNMPERTDALCLHIAKHAFWPYDLIVVDNGSDLVEPSQFTTVRLAQNVQTTGGWLAGLKHADERAEQRDEGYFAYWFLITSAAFVDETDPLTPLASVLMDDDNAVGVHPALTENSTTAWNHLKTRGNRRLRKTWMIDNIASLYRADWFNEIGRFDPELVYAWGVDFETCWKARQEKRGLWVCEDVLVEKITNIGYEMDRMNMSAEERAKNAGVNMHNILYSRYGKDWHNRMTQEYVTNDMV